MTICDACNQERRDGMHYCNNVCLSGNHAALEAHKRVFMRIENRDDQMLMDLQTIRVALQPPLIVCPVCEMTYSGAKYAEPVEVKENDALEALKKMVGLTHFRDKKEVDLLAETIRAALTRETVDLDEMRYSLPNDELGWAAGFNAAIDTIKKHKGKVIG